MSDEPSALMTDIAFGLSGQSVARNYRFLLAAALEAALPRLTQMPGIGVHKLNLPAGGGAISPMSRRTRLILRVPRAAVAEVALLEGRLLHVGEYTLTVEAPQLRALQPYSTLYAHHVAADHNDEAVFMQAIAEELSNLAISCRPICGRFQVLESGALQGFSLMLDRLSRQDSLRLQDSGLGLHRRLGCGLFVPHKSAAAVGMPQ